MQYIAQKYLDYMRSVPALLAIKDFQALRRSQMYNAKVRKCPYRHPCFSHSIAEFVVLIGLNGFIKAADAQEIFTPHDQIAGGYVRNLTCLGRFLVNMPDASYPRGIFRKQVMRAHNTGTLFGRQSQDIGQP